MNALLSTKKAQLYENRTIFKNNTTTITLYITKYNLLVKTVYKKLNVSPSKHLMRLTFLNLDENMLNIRKRLHKVVV